MNRSRKPSCGLRRKISSKRRDGFVVVARIIGELDGDGFSRALRNGPVELLDGALRLHALVEANKSDSFGKTYMKNVTTLIALSGTRLHRARVCKCMHMYVYIKCRCVVFNVWHVQSAFARRARALALLINRISHARTARPTDFLQVTMLGVNISAHISCVRGGVKTNEKRPSNK